MVAIPDLSRFFVFPPFPLRFGPPLFGLEPSAAPGKAEICLSDSFSILAGFKVFRKHALVLCGCFAQIAHTAEAAAERKCGCPSDFIAFTFSIRRLATAFYLNEPSAKVSMDSVTRSSCCTSVDETSIPTANVSWSGGLMLYSYSTSPASRSKCFDMSPRIDLYRWNTSITSAKMVLAVDFESYRSSSFCNIFLGFLMTARTTSRTSTPEILMMMLLTC